MNHNDYNTKLKETSEQVPAELVIQMRQTFTNLFEEEKIPYDETHLRAAMLALHVVHPSLPQMYSTLTVSMILGLYRLIEEVKTGEIVSSIQKKEDADIS